ncbi:MAG: hypothetical protein ACRDTE_19670, partial [Pseudonocardiaceae bacterium]
EHGAQYRHQTGAGGARWREPAAPAGPDEIEVSGPRVLAPGGQVVLAATENLRYGNRAHGYHGGATLAEVAIPFVVLLSPGMDLLDEWHPHTMGEPGWWNGDQVPPAPVAPPPAKRRTQRPAPPAEDLFGTRVARGQALSASTAFTTLHAQLPKNRVPPVEVFATVVDALAEAGGRLPVGTVVQLARSVGRNPRGLVAALGRVLNVDGFTVIDLTDDGRYVVLDQQLLDEQFPT